MADSFRDEVHNIVSVIYPDIQIKYLEFANANISSIVSSLLNKVDKVDGMGLSSNDYTSIEKTKLGGVDTNANYYLHPSTHPVNIIDGSSNPSKYVKTDAVGNVGFDNVTWADVQGKPNSFTPSGHGHSLSDISDAVLKADKSYVDTTLSLLQPLSQKGQANGYVPLGIDGKINAQYLNSLSTIQVFAASSQANMLLLSNVDVGDQCVRTDLSLNNVFILAQTPATDFNNWKQLSVSASIASVNGKTGIVIIDKLDVGLGNVDNTSDISKPISIATQSALSLKQDALVSGTNIKIIEGVNILGSGSASINASTATKLATSRTINGESFDGSVNVNIEERIQTAIASASTCSIGTKGNGETVHVTGTTTIISLGISQTGTRRTVVFDGALTLTYNATSLILPTSSSVTTIIGDTAEFICENGASGYWRCVDYTRANGTPLTLGSRTINGVVFNGSANINIEARLGTAIASATTTTIGTSGLGDTLHVTGTTTIASLGTASQAGVMRTLIFDGALTLTHNATSLICPGAENIVTIAGTSIEVVADTTANWRVVRITHPNVSHAEIGFLDGVTSAIQTQINSKTDLATVQSTQLGVGQTRQNLTGSMSLNTTYTNSTAKPRYVSVTVSSTYAGGTIFCTVNGVIRYGTTLDTANFLVNKSEIILPGETYLFGMSGSGTNTISNWEEIK
jgi:hypothetical protein